MKWQRKQKIDKFPKVVVLNKHNSSPKKFNLLKMYHSSAIQDVQ